MIESVTTVEIELAGCLRTWRERLSPQDAGLPSGGHRRVAGLRREEVAALAGVSVDYLTRLEQGRARRPSGSVLTALATALRLGDDDRAHLFRLAGQALPGTGVIDRHIPASLQRLLDRLVEFPVLVMTAAGEIIHTNALAAALLGDISSATRRERTLAWRHFTGQASRVQRTAHERTEAEAMMVADLRSAFARYPADRHLAELIEDLRGLSPRFEELWLTRSAVSSPARRKTYIHPEVGAITLDCDVLSVHGSDLRVVVYTAAPGTPETAALRLLAAVGLQRFGEG